MLQKLLDDPRGYIREIISGPAAIIILIAFFLPWITISCNSGFGTTDETVSGYDLTKDQSEDDVEQDGDLALWVIPVVAVIALAVVWARLNGGLDALIAARVYLAAGAVGLIIQFLKYLSIRSDMSDAEEQIGKGVIEVSYRYGWWLTALGLVALIAAHFLSEERLWGTRTAPPTPLSDADDFRL